MPRRGLFTELLPRGAPAVINVDGKWGRKMADVAKDAGLDVMSVGWAGEHIRISEITPRSASQLLELVWDGKRIKLDLPARWRVSGIKCG